MGHPHATRAAQKNTVSKRGPLRRATVGVLAAARFAVQCKRARVAREVAELHPGAGTVRSTRWSDKMKKFHQRSVKNIPGATQVRWERCRQRCTGGCHWRSFIRWRTRGRARRASAGASFAGRRRGGRGRPGSGPAAEATSSPGHADKARQGGVQAAMSPPLAGVQLYTYIRLFVHIRAVL